MKKAFVRMTICIVAILVVVLSAGIVGCSTDEGAYIPTTSLVAPTGTEFDVDRPPEVTFAQLYKDYLNDADTADAIYKGKEYAITGIEVEQRSRLAEPQDPDYHFLSGDGLIKFRPRYWGEILDISEGFIVDVVGTVKGMVWGTVLVEDCYIVIVEGGDVVPVGEY